MVLLLSELVWFEAFGLRSMDIEQNACQVFPARDENG
jgi:hypothetical protein